MKFTVSMFKQNIKQSSPCYFFASVSLAMNHDNRVYKVEGDITRTRSEFENEFNGYGYNKRELGTFCINSF